VSDAVGRRRLEGRRVLYLMMLSEAGAVTSVFLRNLPECVVCEQCLSAYLGIDRYAVLKCIRELILAGRFLCTYTECAISRERRLVVRFHSERPTLG